MKVSSFHADEAEDSPFYWINCMRGPRRMLSEDYFDTWHLVLVTDAEFTLCQEEIAGPEWETDNLLPINDGAGSTKGDCKKCLEVALATILNFGKESF